MSPAELISVVEDRLFAAAERGKMPWHAGASLLAHRLGMDPYLALRGAQAVEGLFAQVVADADPRRFRLAEAAERAQAAPALLLPYLGETPDGDDVVAFSLKPGSTRFWRWTCRLDALGPALDERGVLWLRQDAHGWLRLTLKAAAYGRLAEEARAPGETRAATAARYAVERRPPEGALVLDPAAIKWTKADALKGVEAIEILDAPAMGPLGRALKALNPRIGTETGVALTGQEPARVGRRAA